MRPIQPYTCSCLSVRHLTVLCCYRGRGNGTSWETPHRKGMAAAEKRLVERLVAFADGVDRVRRLPDAEEQLEAIAWR